jgi:NADH-quinone oxidoreductase subunit J
MSVDLIVFLILGGIAVFAALGMLFSRNAIYSALFLVVNFLMVAGIYLFLGATFIGLAQITVYAGAIMVLFLFVIMLLGGENLPMGEYTRWQRLLIGVTGVILAAEFAYLLFVRAGNANPIPAASTDTGPAAIGISLFTKYTLPFEITSVLLLAALVGAIYLTKKEGKKE